MIDTAVYQVLAGSIGVTSISPRVYFMAAPDDATQYPCSEYKLVGGASEAGLTTTGVLRARVEINAYGFDAEVVANLSLQQVLAVESLNAGGTTQLADRVRLLSVELLNPGTDFVTEQRIFRRMVEFYVFYTLPS